MITGLQQKHIRGWRAILSSIPQGSLRDNTERPHQALGYGTPQESYWSGIGKRFQSGWPLPKGSIRIRLLNTILFQGKICLRNGGKLKDLRQYPAAKRTG